MGLTKILIYGAIAAAGVYAYKTYQERKAVNAAKANVLNQTKPVGDPSFAMPKATAVTSDPADAYEIVY